MQDIFDNTSHKQDPLSSPEAIQQLSGFFELLSNIDKRLKKEDSEYREKYYLKEKN